MKTGLGIALAMAIVLIALSVRFSAQAPTQILSGPDALASNENGDLLLVAGDHAMLHDRSGVGAGTVAITPLPLFPDSGVLLLTGPDKLLITSGGTDTSPERVLLRCWFNESDCEPVLTDNPAEWVSSAAVHLRSGTTYVANARDGLLRKYDSEGALVAESSQEIIQTPVLRLQDGLLFLNSNMGPAISVFRPDDGSFGRQLDEILLMPPPAIETDQTRVSDFVQLGRGWWVTLENPDDNDRGVYRYDSQWNYQGQLPLPKGFMPEQLLAWGNKLLIRDSSQTEILRFTAEGQAEVPFLSAQLSDLIDQQKRSADRTSMMQRLSLASLAAIVLCALLFAYVHRVRSMVYKGGATRGADPLEDHADDLDWLEPESSRRSRFMQLGALYFCGSAGAVIVAMGLAINANQLTALLLVLLGPAVTMVLLFRSPIGHIGFSGDLVALVDHNNLYQMGRESQIHYRARYLIIDDVVVFTGASLMPSFNRAQVKALQPLAEAGVKVERKAVWIKLLQARHPIALGAILTLACWVLAAILLFA